MRIVPVDLRHLPALYRICLLTGDSGGSAEALYRDAELLGHYYAAPYAVLEPESCSVLLDAADAPCGYLVGTTDSARFAARMNAEWLPPLRSRLPRPADDGASADERLLRLIHAPFPLPPCAATHPAHLHIDLLPHAQGQGAGRRLMTRFLDHLRRCGVSGVHLGVGARNTRAMAFYERLGFACLDTPAWGRWYGMRLSR